MAIEINQVGKRWFHCSSKENNSLIIVEATYRNGNDVIINHSQSTEVGYQVYDWIPKRFWTLTGIGSRKYRDEIIKALENYINI